MSVAELAAEQLGLTSFEEEEPKATSNGVTSFTLNSEIESYEIYVVKETDDDQSLQSAARLAGFYNTRFFYEFLKVSKIDFPIGKLSAVFNIEDGDQQIAVFAVQRNEGRTKAELSLEDLNQVAEAMARLHAVRFFSRDEEFKKTVQENHEVVSSYQSEQRNSSLQMNVEYLCNESAKYFKNPELIAKRVNTLLDSASSAVESDSKTHVICHGHLTADALTFDKHGKLAEITEWDNVHFGNPAEDLSNLIISSASKSIRRNHFMKVFRTYFYTLVDILAPKFKLADLKRHFKTTHRDAVLNSVEILVETFESEEDEERKRDFAERWETALEDAFEFENGDYISDDEHCFFSK